MTEDVRDRPAEVGIKLNNILTALILGVMGWVGYNISDMRDSLAQVRLDDALMANEIMHLHEQFDKHLKDCEKRWSKSSFIGRDVHRTGTK